ncbi:MULTISPECIES: (Fe-S)-binding protein [Nitrospirillum]|uniref:L-lactate dehydrogenase complex protein LldE n=1 Tax=Nitrospirillum amazonense TaxID=28077 RepID=A0A560G3F9_9PROT|nr:(Fe-S)-binding protein [Nitrospirillum amazonense]MEC4594119.1 (Fe-S)-binding protein [Nitrospirillum amazonense]TWB28417.1 L-lactate dehydrogenase complex protein LldE [Nitrospirillum amazonense]
MTTTNLAATNTAAAATPAARPDTVYFFGTCLVDMLYPEAGLAGMDLLRHAGVTVVFPEGQSCCGQPARNSGYVEEAREVARAQLDAFPGDIPIVVPSGSCAGMMKTHYAHLFEGDPDQPRAIAFAARIHELTAFLVNVLGVKLADKGAPVTVTWHPSCHSLREMGVREEPKALLRQLANVTLVENKRERECCGFGGTFAVRQTAVSTAMVSDKLASVRETGAGTLLSSDCGCLMNIGGHAEKVGDGTRCRHIAEFLMERCHGG